MHLETVLAKVVLVVSAGMVGWYVSRRWRLRNPSQPLSPSRDYFAGLNFLANEQPDRALEAFLRAVEVDKDTVETHLALGALYRRRGEVDRAIRVHQNLMARPNLDPMHREQATYALAQDYLRAGLLDRAEKLMLQISEAGSYRIAALRDLVSIYELQRDWERAIAVHRQLARVANPPQPSAIAHYFCELAEGYRAQGDLEAAQRSLRSARGEMRKFPRSALIRADIAVDLNETEMALKLLRETAESHPQLASEVLPRLTRALRAGAREKDLGTVLQSMVAAAPALRQPLALALIAQGELESSAAVAIVRDYVAAEPGIGEVVAALRPGEADLDDASLRRLCDALRRQTIRNARYRCSDCGFASTTFFWQCPGCKGWDSLRSLAYVDLMPASGSRRNGKRADA